MTTRTASDDIVAHADDPFAHVEPDMSRRILKAALACFARSGYHAASTRQIAHACGLSPAGLYVHYASKEDLLYEISVVGHRTSLSAVQEGIASVPTAQRLERIKEATRQLVNWHVDHQDLARVVAFEQDALASNRRDRLRPYRREFFATIEREMIAGLQTGEVDVDDTTQVTRALLSLCTDVARWYRPGRDIDRDELAECYSDMAVRLVGARGTCSR